MAKRSLPNFSNVAAPRQRHDLSRGDEPDLSGALLLSTTSLLLLFSTPLFPIFSALLFLPLFELDAQVVLFLPALRAGPSSQHVFWLIEPHSAHCQSQRNWHLR